MKRISISSYEIIESFKRKKRIAEAVRRRKRAAFGLLPDQRIRTTMNKRRKAVLKSQNKAGLH